MTDTTRELDEYAGDCRFCGGSIFDYDANFTEVDGEVAHIGCLEQANEERLAWDRESWELDYENRGTE